MNPQPAVDVQNPPNTDPAPAVPANPVEPVVPAGATPDYANCRDVWDALHRPISAGEPGFKSKFNRDGDGVGCESRPR
ncbi:excalibur calcium-binding domain-containing protein [Mobiluncus mulieris]|uniref:excalibur calcium-binding domain-containing protein n=1 Tax=Mobiluncus mulieris TaxID=2052 RepID=UPI0024302F9C|nr:excalibur calcium-binding domain-containing protein [Mobiluncus mulieris]